MEVKHAPGSMVVTVAIRDGKPEGTIAYIEKNGAKIGTIRSEVMAGTEDQMRAEAMETAKLFVAAPGLVAALRATRRFVEKVERVDAAAEAVLVEVDAALAAAGAE